eukprot:Skav200816  [mRNA]  locus=scaffold454:45465:48980:- [translate_table: standard]
MGERDTRCVEAGTPLVPVSGGTDAGQVQLGASRDVLNLGVPADGMVSQRGVAVEEKTSVSPPCTTLRELGGWLKSCVPYLKRCKSWPMFTSISNDMPEDDSASEHTGNSTKPPKTWVALADWALQDLEDEPESRKKGQSCESLRKQLQRFDVWNEPVTTMSFRDFFVTKNVDYQGEEVRVAQQVVWEAVANSFPQEVGHLDLVKFCTLGTLHYVEHFEEYLVPMEQQRQVKPPRVMVEDSQWPAVCEGLLKKGVCEVWPVDELHHIQGAPLLNGMFAVGKGEYVGLLETQRLIMNLVPTNSICNSIQGDVASLPMISGFNGVLLDEGEVILTSSEDIRCFFYLFADPQSWKKFLGFNKLLPKWLVPSHLHDRDCVLVSRVLPMGFSNSVSIAQHVHRNLIGSSDVGGPHQLLPGGELRRDRPVSASKKLHRVYLDNFDQLEVVDPKTAGLIQGTVSGEVLALRQTYQQWQVPRHPKKAVQRQLRAEVQGSVILGDVGVVVPKPQKVAQYISLGLELIKAGRASLKQLQIVCGGLVYLAMFRRPLLSSLNQVWVFMQQLKEFPPVVKLPLPAPVQRELFRFLCLAPLSQLNFRAPMLGQVTCSDASSTGGGFCVSKGLTGFGVAAANAPVRGEPGLVEGFGQVLSVGLFDGLGALRIACDLVGFSMAGHVSVEVDKSARRVVESYFPDTVFHDDICTLTEDEIRQWSYRFQNVELIIIGAGPPCQGVSGLNSDRRGALKDARSSLFQQVPRVVGHFRHCFPWAQVRFIGESVASMDDKDRSHMSEAFDELPWKCDPFGLSLCHRPRYFWVDWEIIPGEGFTLVPPVQDNGMKGTIQFDFLVDSTKFLLKGWTAPEGGLPTFTTPRPRSTPGRKPAGLATCQPHERQRWVADEHRYPPYQYRDGKGLQDAQGNWRLPSAEEKEVLMGLPLGYTKACMPKGEQKTQNCLDKRHQLIGNSWHVGVAAFLLSHLGQILGLCQALTVAQLMDRLTPGHGAQLASVLLRPPLQVDGKVIRTDGQGLARKLMGLTSVKGEDIMLQASSEQLVKHHRLRSSVPASLWKWREVVGWSWRGTSDHINTLELRAIYTTFKWLTQQLKISGVRVIHLTDSLVCLHALSRGRTSSRKMRRTLIRTQALLLRHDLHPLWTYIHTAQNPADRPSRRGRFVKKRWVKR